MSKSVLVAVLLFVATVSTTAAQSETTFSLRPANPDPDLAATQSYFILELAPGATVADELLVLNSGTTPLTLDLYAVDAVTGSTTGAVYTNRGTEISGAGAWLSLPEGPLSVPPNSTTSVPFHVRVPANARPGQFLGGIGAQTLDPGAAQAVGASAHGRQGQFRLTTVTRAIVAVAVTVPGALQRKLSATEVRMLSGPGGARLSVGVRNEGNVMVKPHGHLVLRDPVGAERGRVPLDMDTILPGGSAQFAVPWPKELPAGQYRADLALETSDALPVSAVMSDALVAPEPMRIETNGQALTVELSELEEVIQSGVVAVPGTIRIAPTEAGWPAWLPWVAILGIVVAAGNVALAIRLKRR
jgi:hypothetical protein